jgi:class 3 adenylate cyclase
MAETIPDAELIELDPQDWSWRVAEDDLPPELPPILEFLTGTETEHPAEAQLLTIVFLDVVGSTQLVARLGDREWADMLRGLTAILDDQLVARRGTLVNSAGDGFLTRFDSVSHGLGFAAAMVESAEAIGLQIRVGVHTGECQVEGDDLRGVQVHAAARIMSMAEPSEILVSDIVRSLAADWVELRHRGDHELRGVPGKWPLYRLER